MKLKAFFALASARFPALAESLTLANLTHFVSVASDFIRRAHGLFPIARYSAPIEFLTASLQNAVPASLLAQLWSITLPSLYTCYIDTDKVFRTLGIPSADRPNSSIEIPEHIYKPPVEHCLQCDPAMHRGLTQRPVMRGYLYDIDGVRTVYHVTRYCRCGCCLSLSLIPTCFIPQIT